MPQAKTWTLPLDDNSTTEIMPMLNTLVVNAGNKKRRCACSKPVSKPEMPINPTATIIVRSIAVAVSASAGVLIRSVAKKRLIGPAYSQITLPIAPNANSNTVKTVLTKRHKLR